MIDQAASRRLLAISDIHGHGEGLLRLLRAADYRPSSDQLVLLGDYIDPAPETWGTLELIYALTKEGAVALPGNMETALFSSSAASSLPEARRSWLANLPAYYLEGNRLFVHAGIRPGRPLEQQTLRDVTEIREPFWQSAPRLPFEVIFGHTPTFKLGAPPGKICRIGHCVGIDTGAKHGYRLTLLDVTGQIAYSCSTGAQHRYQDVRREAVDAIDAFGAVDTIEGRA